MKVTIKRRVKSEAELLDHATNNLLRALKRDMLKKGELNEFPSQPGPAGLVRSAEATAFLTPAFSAPAS